MSEHSGGPDPAEPAASVPDPFDGPEWDRERRRTAGPAREPDGDGVVLRRERRRRSKYEKRRKRRRWLVAGGIIGFVLVAAVGWLLYSGFKARTQLEAVRAEVRQLRSEIAAGDLDGARATAAMLRTHARSAHDLTSDPVWAAGAAIPWVGNPLDSARTITDSVDHVAATALPALVEASSGLDPSALRRPDGSIDLSAISSVAPAFTTAADALHGAVDGLAGAPTSTWIGAVDTARSDLADQLGRLSTTVDSADVAAQVLPTMLGADGPRNYMVGFQNEAELRGTGGLPGAFAILHADHGKFSFTRFESDNELQEQATGLDFGQDFNRLWAGANATSDYRDSNVSPHFPYAAQVWTAQWKAKSGQQLDGAITLDPTALSYLLKVAGGTKLPDGTRVNAKNVIALTQNQAYLRFPLSVHKRKDFLLVLAKSISKQLVDTRANTTALVRAAAHGTSEHRLLVWSRDPEVEKLLATTKISGVVPDSSAPYAGIALNNGGANKLDYYLDASTDIATSGCGDTRDMTVTLKLRNGAPSDLTNYMYGGYGKKGLPPVRGDNLILASYYAGAGTQLSSVTLNGKPFTATAGTERGHPVFAMRVYLPRGAQQTVVLHLKVPGSSDPLTIRPQPMVRPMTVTTEDSGCDG